MSENAAAEQRHGARPESLGQHKRQSRLALAENLAGCKGEHGLPTAVPGPDPTVTSRKRSRPASARAGLRTRPDRSDGSSASMSFTGLRTRRLEVTLTPAGEQCLERLGRLHRDGLRSVKGGFAMSRRRDAGRLDSVALHKAGRFAPRSQCHEPVMLGLQALGKVPEETAQPVTETSQSRAIEEQETGGGPSIWTDERDRALWSELHG